MDKIASLILTAGLFALLVIDFFARKKSLEEVLGEVLIGPLPAPRKENLEQPSVFEMSPVEAQTLLTAFEEQESLTADEKLQARQLLSHSDIEIESRAFDLLSRDPMEMPFLLGHMKDQESRILGEIDEQRHEAGKISTYERFFKTRNLRLLARPGIAMPPKTSRLTTVWNVDLDVARRMLEQVLTPVHEVGDIGAETISAIQPGRRDLLPRLNAIIKDGSKELIVRVSAVQAVSEIDSRSGWETLVNALQSELPVIRYCAADIMGRLGKLEAIPHLIQAASGPNPHVQSIALDGLSRLNAIEALPLMIQALDSPNDEVVFSAKQALMKLNNREKVSAALLQTLSDSHPERQASVIELLATMGERQILPLLKELLESNDSTLSMAAANGMLILRETRYLDQVLKISEKLGVEANRVAQELEKYSSDTGLRDFLASQAVRHDEPEMQFFALQIILNELSRHPGSFFTDILRTAKKSENCFIRGSAVLGLAQTRQAEVWKDIAEELSNPSDYVRACAVSALYECEGSKVLPQFETMLATEQAEDVLFNIINCLGRENTSQTLNILKRKSATIPEKLKSFALQTEERIKRFLETPVAKPPAENHPRQIPEK